MAKYRITGLDQSTNHTSLVITATTEEEAYLISINQKKVNPLTIELISSAKSYTFFSDEKRQLNDRELFLFCERLSPMLKMGIPIRKAYEFIAKGSPSPKIRKTSQLLFSLSESLPASESFVQCKMFPPLFTGCFKVGSDAANIPEVLDILGRFYNMRVRLSASIRNAMIQPGIAIVVIVCFMLFSLLVLVPRIQSVFETMRYKPDGLLGIMVFLSQGLKMIWPLLILIIVGLLFLIFTKNIIKERIKESLIMKFAPLRAVFHGLRQTSFLYALSILLRANVPHNKTLEYLIVVCAGSPLEKQLIAAKDFHTRHGQFSSAIKMNCTMLDEEIFFALEIGETSAQLDQQIGRLAEVYEDTTNSAAESLAAKLNPIVILIAASLVVITYLGIFGSLMSMCNKMMRGGN